MGTRTVRIKHDDIERVRRLSGLDDSAAFPTAMSAALSKVEESARITEHVRAAVREELEGALA
jgi:hypothetical protein